MRNNQDVTTQTQIDKTTINEISPNQKAMQEEFKNNDTMFITEDQGIQKQIIAIGQGNQKPHRKQIAEILYQARHINGEVFDQQLDTANPFKISLEDEQLQNQKNKQVFIRRGLSLSICSMLKGEKSIFTLTPQYAYGNTGLPPRVQENQTVQYEIELLNFYDPVIEKYQYPLKERLTFARQHKNNGNDLFKQQKFKEAIEQYEEAVDFLDFGEQIEDSDDLRLSCWSNLAAVNLKLYDYFNLANNCQQVLRFQPENVKALYRLSLAKIHFGLFEEALKYLEQAIKLEPKNQAVQEELEKLNKKIQLSKKKEKTTWGQLFTQDYYEGREITTYSNPTNPIVFLDIQIGQEAPVRIEIELFANYVPITAENFRCLCTGEKGIGINGKPLCYKGSQFYRIVKDFVIQGGDIINNDNNGGESIYGAVFDDENFKLKHINRGYVSMANSGKNTNSSKFFFLLKLAPWLDDMNVVFGYICKNKSFLTQLENVDLEGEAPKTPIIIINSGQVK